MLQVTTTTELPLTVYIESRSSYLPSCGVSWVVWVDGEQHYFYGGCSGLFGVADCVLFPLVEEFKSCEFSCFLPHEFYWRMDIHLW